MQKPLATQAELFVYRSDLEHPALHVLDDTEAVLDWSTDIILDLCLQDGPSKLPAFDPVSRVVVGRVVSNI